MAKQVTRTVTAYTHTFLKVENNDGVPQIVGTASMTTHIKMSATAVKRYIKEHEELEGYISGGVTESLKTYAMDLDAFLAAATEVPTREPKEKNEQ